MSSENNWINEIAANSLNRGLTNLNDAHRVFLGTQCGAPLPPSATQFGNNYNYTAPVQKSGGKTLKYAGLIALALFVGPAAAYYASGLMDQVWGEKDVAPTPVVAPEKPDQDTKYDLKVSIGD